MEANAAQSSFKDSSKTQVPILFCRDQEAIGGTRAQLDGPSTMPKLKAHKEVKVQNSSK